MDSTKDHRCYAMVDGGRRQSFDGGGASGEILDRLECAEILEAELRSSVLSSFPSWVTSFDLCKHFETSARSMWRVK